MSKLLLGVDVGGTFTDIVLMDQNGRCRVAKVPSAPSRPAESTLVGIRQILEAAGVSAEDIAQIQHTHSNTLATNAVIERAGARTGVIVTDGTRDLFELQRLAVDNPNSFDAGRPEPLVRRSLVREVGGRFSARGEELVPLDLSAVRQAATELIEAKCEAIAVSLLHSYANPAHELQVRECIAEIDPNLPVELSHEVWPQAREYERSSLTVLNASLRKIISNYLTAVESGTREIGLERVPMVARSNGGRQQARNMIAQPIGALLSGPAANVTGAAEVALQAGWRDSDLITIDVGGTSADIGMVRAGAPLLSSDEQVGGIPVLLPSVAVSAIGSGGSSLVTLEGGKRLRVGPESLGSDPGPASYGKQTERAGLSDAFVMCGWLDENLRLGGNVKLSRANAEKVFGELAAPLGADSGEVADGAIQIAVAAMAAEATRFLARHTNDYTDFAMVASGGAGPLIAALLAEELHINSVLIPRFPGVLSALGAAGSDIEGDLIVPVYRRLSQMGLPDFNEVIAQARGQIDEWAKSEASGEQIEGLIVEWSLEMRYFGQGYDLAVPVELGWLETANTEAIAVEFHKAHKETFGHASADRDVWVGEIRVHLRLTSGAPAMQPSETGAEVEPVHSRQIRLRGELREVAVYQRDGLTAAAIIEGPAIVEQMDSTLLVPDGWNGTVDAANNVILRRI